MSITNPGAPTSGSNLAKDAKGIQLTDIEKENIILVKKYKCNPSYTEGLGNFGKHNINFDKNKSL